MTARAAMNFEPLTEVERQTAPDHHAEAEDTNAWTPIVPVPADAPRAMPVHSLGRRSHRWAYRDAEGRLVFLAVRFDPPGERKQVIPLTYCENKNGRREWRWTALPAPRLIFGMDNLVAQPEAPVLVVEGEKVVVAAQAMFPDHNCTTSPGGSQAANKADWSPLKGRAVILWPDNDESGAKYAGDVARLAHEAGAASVAVVNVPEEFPEGWDLADDPPDGWDPDGLRRLLETAVPWEPEATPKGTNAVADVDGDGDAEDALDDPVVIEAIVQELADLSPVAYERRREKEAEKLEMRVTILDGEVKARRGTSGKMGAGRELSLPEPDPWPEPVDGAALLDDLVVSIHRHLALPDGAAEAIALWIVHAHAFDAFQVTPRLALQSPEKRCGKTTALRLVSQLVPRRLSASNVTTAVVFRVIELARPTLLIDEADSFIKTNEELRGILNSGHDRDGSVLRTAGDDFEPRQFSTWAPVAIALIGRLPGTLEDRSIVVSMHRKRRDEQVERLRTDRAGHLEILARKAARWAKDNSSQLADADPAIPSGLHDRAADNWTPLFAIADLSGGDWKARARSVAQRMCSNDAAEDPSAKTQLLADIGAVFSDQGTDRLPSADLCEALHQMEDRPWPEWRNGRPITVRQLAQLLKAFDIKPKVIRTLGGTPRGYLLEDFTDAFARYPLLQSATPQQVKESGAYSGFQSATWDDDVALRNRLNPAENLECCGVAAETPPGRDDHDLPDIPPFLDRRGDGFGDVDEFAPMDEFIDVERDAIRWESNLEPDSREVIER